MPAGIRAQNLNVQLAKRTTELCHTLAALGVLPDDAEHGMLVRLEGTEHPCALRPPRNASKYDSVLSLSGRSEAASAFNEDQQCRRDGSVFEPAVLAVVNLD
jgi:hypothetical protein